MDKDTTLPAPMLAALKRSARLYLDTWRANKKDEAQDLLSGRTHYVDDGTLRYHLARVLETQVLAGGAFCAIKESVAIDSQNSKRGQRWVVFDVFGTVLDGRPGLDDTPRTSAAADKQFNAWLATFDPVAYYRTVLLKRAERLAEEARHLSNAVAKV